MNTIITYVTLGAELFIRDKFNQTKENFCADNKIPGEVTGGDIIFLYENLHRIDVIVVAEASGGGARSVEYFREGLIELIEKRELRLDSQQLSHLLKVTFIILKKNGDIDEL